MNHCRAAINSWWRLMQALADPGLDCEVRADTANNEKVSPSGAWLVPSTTSLALSQLGLLEDTRETPQS
jgi:hypothetical protein